MFQQVAKFVFTPGMHRIEKEIIAGIVRGAAATLVVASTWDLGKSAFQWTKSKFQNRKNNQSATDFQSAPMGTQEVQPTA